MTVSLAYITCRDLDEARRLGRALVEERLAACVNIIPGIQSLYWWQGEVQEDSEVVLIVKTRDGLFAALNERIVALHGYDVPCVLELPIGRGNPAYLRWLEDETAPDGSGQ